MSILLVFAGIIGGLFVYVISYYILKSLGYCNNDDEEKMEMDFWINILIGIISGFIVIIALIVEHVMFTIGLIIGIILSILYIIQKLFSANGRYIRLMKKIEKIENNILKLPRYMTLRQKQAKNLLEETQDKLREQAYDILIMNSIKIAKNLELRNKHINIQKELDELEALQILNKN